MLPATILYLFSRFYTPFWLLQKVYFDHLGVIETHVGSFKITTFFVFFAVATPRRAAEIICSSLFVQFAVFCILLDHHKTRGCYFFEVCRGSAPIKRTGHPVGTLSLGYHFVAFGLHFNIIWVQIPTRVG